MRSRLFLATAILSVLTSFIAGRASAASIIGGSSLLTASYADQLESWLGQGPIELTNIFTRQAQDSSNRFHNVVDGKGATFVVLDVTGPGGDTSHAGIVGGYNPQSWNSSFFYNLSPLVSDRTGFLFNFTTNSLFRQRTTALNGGDWSGLDSGLYQTVGHPNLGPIFGIGHDLLVDASLSLAYSQLVSYNPDDAPTFPAATLFGGNYDFQGMTIRGLEVFTVAASTVPEPGVVVLLGVGLAGIAASRRRRK